MPKDTYCGGISQNIFEILTETCHGINLNRNFATVILSAILNSIPELYTPFFISVTNFIFFPDIFHLTFYFFIYLNFVSITGFE